MKLISCYIENFGNIKQRSFDFGRGLTSVCEHNGYGKTTLASFFKAMFYGLKQTRKSDKELGERERYYPFEGGKFGGSVTLEKGGAVYKIERFFDRRSVTGDTCTVYENGEVISTEAGACDDFGRECFGLDEQSFLRTVFINSTDTESGATGDISRMLNGFVDDADFDGAKKILEKQQKEYKAGRGRGGKIDEKHVRINELKSNIDNKEKINGELSRKYAERSELAKTVVDLEEKSTSSRDIGLVLQKWRTYDGFTADAEAEREKLNAIAEKYPAGLPSAEEASELKRCAEELKLANERQISAVFSSEKADRLNELSVRFSGGVPSDAEMSSAGGISASVIRLEAEIANCEGFIKGGVEGKFPVGIPDGEEVKKYSDKLILLREKKNTQTSARTDKKIPIIFALLALALIGAGAGLMFVNIIAGGVCLGVGAVSALAAVFTYFKIQINSVKSTVPSAETGGLENEIRSFLARCGYYSDGGIEVDFNNLTRDIEEYKSGLAEREKYESIIAEKRAEADEAKAKVSAFLKGYGFTGGNAQEELALLRAFVTEYTALKAEKEDIEKRSDECRLQIEEYSRAVRGILTRYSIEESGNHVRLAEEIERDRAEADRLKERAEGLEKRAASYREENGLKERPASDGEDTRSIDAELSKKRDELSLLDRDIADDEAAVERLDELKEELETAKEEEGALKKKYDILCKTLSLLEKAEQNLKDRYVSPVKNSFLSYSALLEKVLGERVAFDKDFKVKFERGGELRSDSHLSAGQKSLCALCLRLALIDNMYKDEKAFIIMDDPFVHLDGEHMKRAEALLKELAKNRQIIYFCCHESRRV